MLKKLWYEYTEILAAYEEAKESGALVPRDRA